MVCVEISDRGNMSKTPRCCRITRAKAEAIPIRRSDVVLSADTTVAVGRRILGKPEDAGEAEAFLRLMSGRRHRVITAIAVRKGKRFWERDVTTKVRMKQLSEAEITGYLASGDWIGKAGAYAIQGPAAAFIPWIEGSYSAVMGLPLHETAMLLQAAGISDRLP